MIVRLNCKCFGRNPAFVRIRPTPLAGGANQGFHPAILLHMALYMSFRIRLQCQAALGNGLADQENIRKVGGEALPALDLLCSQNQTGLPDGGGPS